MPNIYNLDLLHKIITRDNCIISVNDYKLLTRNTNIKFTCHCGKNMEKRFRYLFENGGAFCSTCTKKNTGTKLKQTNLEIFGVEYPSQSEEIKEKMKKTNLKKFGVEYPSQSEEIKEKKKQTNLKNLGFEYPTQSQKVIEKQKENNLIKYGVEYPSQLEEVKEKTKQTNLKIYGVEHSLQSKEVRKKGKRTNLEKYGVEYSQQSEEVKEKIKQTNLKRHGVENPLQSEKVKEKIKQTNLKRHGVENPGQSEKVKEKMKQTNLEKFGVKYAMQNSDVANKCLKNSFKSKNYIFPDGSEIKVQGYENIALDYLIKSGYKIEDIITSRTEIPEIWYSDIDGKIHRYYCDIYIPSENKIIEVKSIWTYKKDLHINTIKEETCKTEGYNFQFWVINKNNNIVII